MSYYSGTNGGIVMYEVLKAFCEDNGKYRQYYYELIKCKNNIIDKICMDDSKNHRHSYIFSCVYDLCKKCNITERQEIIELFENGYIYEVMTPMCLVHNYEVQNGIKH